MIAATPRGRWPLRNPVFAALLLAAAPTAAQLDVAGLDVARSGRDLVLSWTPVAGADGYRVYRADDDLWCDSAALVHEGTATAYGDTAAFDRPGFSIWRVVAFQGAAEGELTEPAYLFHAELFFDPARSSGNWLAFPHHLGLATFQELCDDLNAAPGGVRVQTLSRYLTALDRLVFKLCVNPLPALTPAPGEGLGVVPVGPGERVTLWGHAHPDRDFTFTVAAGAVPGRHFVALPFDHAYFDLAQVARELPAAVGVELFDSASDALLGLTRATSSGPWTGTNVVLHDRRDRALVLSFDRVPVAWTPRRLCGTPCPVPLARVGPLLAVRDGGDVELHWTPELLAVGGYRVWRVDDPALVPLVPTLPELALVPAIVPALPFVDAGAAAVPATYYYQVAAQCEDGSLGGI